MTTGGLAEQQRQTTNQTLVTWQPHKLWEAAWPIVAAFLDDLKDLCRLSALNQRVRAVSLSTVADNLLGWPFWKYRSDSENHCDAVGHCLVDPTAAVPVTMGRGSLWQRYWTQANSWWREVA